MRLLVAALLAALLSPSRAAAQPADPGAMVQRYVDALNAKDLATALSSFSDAAAYGGSAGRDYIRARLARDFSLAASLAAIKRPARVP